MALPERRADISGLSDGIWGRLWQTVAVPVFQVGGGAGAPFSVGRSTRSGRQARQKKDFEMGSAQDVKEDSSKSSALFNP